MKTTLFKLPLLLVVFYWLLYSVFIVIYLTKFDNDFISLYVGTDQIALKIVKQVLISFFLQIPNSVVLFTISTIAFNQYSISIINRKNIINTFLVAIFIVLSYMVFRWSYYSYSYDWIVSKLRFLNINDGDNFSAYIFHLAEYLIFYFFITLCTYLSIKLCKKNYICNEIILTETESQNLHMVLFICFYNCFFITMSYLLLFDGMYYSLSNLIFSIVLLAIFLSIVNLIGYFLLRKCFTAVTEILALKKVIFSSLITFILNCLLLVLILYIYNYIYNFLPFDIISSTFKLFYLWMFLITLLISSCLLVRKMTKLFFDKH